MYNTRSTVISTRQEGPGLSDLDPFGVSRCGREGHTVLPVLLYRVRSRNLVKELLCALAEQPHQRRLVGCSSPATRSISTHRDWPDQGREYRSTRRASSIRSIPASLRPYLTSSCGSRLPNLTQKQIMIATVYPISHRLRGEHRLPALQIIPGLAAHGHLITTAISLPAMFCTHVHRLHPPIMRSCSIEPSPSLFPCTPIAS